MRRVAPTELLELQKCMLVTVAYSATEVNAGVAPLVKGNEGLLDRQGGHPSQEVEWASSLVISACGRGRGRGEGSQW